jgi:hypothetical protein
MSAAVFDYIAIKGKTPDSRKEDPVLAAARSRDAALRAQAAAEEKTRAFGMQHPGLGSAAERAAESMQKIEDAVGADRINEVVVIC